MGIFDGFLRLFIPPPCKPIYLHVKFHYKLRKGRLMSTATLTWVLPATRTDGSALVPSAIASVNILEDGTMIGSTTGPATTFETGPLTAGVHSFTVTVTDTLGNVSAASKSASVTVPTAAPSPATDLTAVLN